MAKLTHKGRTIESESDDEDELEDVEMENTQTGQYTDSGLGQRVHGDGRGIITRQCFVEDGLVPESEAWVLGRLGVSSVEQGRPPDRPPALTARPERPRASG